MEMAGMEALWKWLAAFISSWTGWKLELTVALVETVTTLLILLILRWAVRHVVKQRIQESTRRYHWRRWIDYAWGVLALLAVGRIWFDGLRNIGTFLGLLSAGVAVALGDLLANFAGWIFILTRRPYAVGDRIEIDGLMGDVADIKLFNTTLRECGGWVDADQPTGRIVHVPNGLVFKKPLANYTAMFRYVWNEIPVMMTFESNWRKAKELLTRIVHDHARPMVDDARKQIDEAAFYELIRFDHLEPTVWTDVKDSGVVLTLRYLTPARGRRQSVSEVWESILEAFAQEPDIDLAYPTQREFINYVEGKPGTIPPTAAPLAERASETFKDSGNRRGAR